MKSLSYLFLAVSLFFMGCTEQQNGSESQSSDQGSEAPIPPPPPKPKKIETPEKVTFPSLDGLDITAHVYQNGPAFPTILLCHQARYNKYEYDSIAPVLTEMGFNCIATDQRSGGVLFDQPNETFDRATEAGKPTDYLDAEQDIIAAIDYAYDQYQKPIILWGSSYSSTLALYQGLENDKVMATISFSPGNYFADEKGSLIEMLEGYEKPFFVTSSKEEAPGTTALLAKALTGTQQIQFAPDSAGYHGSKALWAGQPGGEEYWTAITAFLEGLK